MLVVDAKLQADDLEPAIGRLWDLSARKILTIESDWSSADGAPVSTVEGRYAARGWTEWTQGFQFGSALLQFDATGDDAFLRLGRDATHRRMAPHITHMGVHDHGFNNVSTYGNLWRLMGEGRVRDDPGERRYLQLALAASGAVQAGRWTPLSSGGGFIHSFNGPHSLFVDTMRSLRSLSLAHLFGHVLLSEQDERVSLLGRLIDHARATATYAVYRGTGRDVYDVRGRVAHESIFNVGSGRYLCANSQQGYSPFTTWMRGLAWVMLGFAEQLEFMAIVADEELDLFGGRTDIEGMLLETALDTCDFYIAHVPTDGVPYWDTGAPGLACMGDYLDRPADPFNRYEPVDSSAAAIAAQALLRVGHLLRARGDTRSGDWYWQAGLTVVRTLLGEPYLCVETRHQGLLLHSVYHRPNGWDYVPPGFNVPYGESSMWGDYHMREVALYIQRVAGHQTYLSFFGGCGGKPEGECPPIAEF